MAHSLASEHLISNPGGEATLQVPRQYKRVRKFMKSTGTSVLETGEGIGTAFLVETDQPREKDQVWKVPEAEGGKSSTIKEVRMPRWWRVALADCLFWLLCSCPSLLNT